MALACNDIIVELREISLKDRPLELLKASPKGTVPVLVIDDDKIIDESLDIMLWSFNIHHNDLELNKKIKLIDINDTIFKKWLDRYKYNDRYPQFSKKYYRSKCDKILFEYERELNDKNYLINDHIDLVDFAIFPFVRQFANVDYDWFKSNYVNLTHWLERIVSSDLFGKIMNKYQIWIPESIPLIINFKD